VADLVRLTWIVEMLRDQTGQSQPVAQLAHQQRTGIGCEPFRASLDHDAAIALQRKQRTLNFTHGVFAGSARMVGFNTPLLLRCK